MGLLITNTTQLIPCLLFRPSCVAATELFSHSALQVQLAELIDCLDKEFWEIDLYTAIEEIRDEVHTHMDITEDLTNKARGSNKSFLTVANGKKFCFFFIIISFSLNNEFIKNLHFNIFI